MSKQFTELSDKHIQFIAEQRIFFVAMCHFMFDSV